MTSPRSANTTAEKNALRVRNSIVRSLRAISQAAKSVSPTGSHGLAICGGVGCGVDTVARLVAHEFSPLHHRRMRRQRKSLGEIVRNDDDCRPSRSQLLE